MRKIARDAQIYDDLLYSYFKSKEDLAFGVLQSAFKTLDDTISHDQNLSAHENIKTSITKFIDLIINQEEKIRLLVLMGFQKENLKF